MRVLLLNMPFVSLSRPAIGISILKARLAQDEQTKAKLALLTPPAGGPR